VEKPMTLTEKDAEELIDLAASRNLILMVGHLLQYHPAFVRLKQIASDGELGRINYIYSHRLNLGKIRREENILWSFAPHDISMILALAGEERKTCWQPAATICIKKSPTSPHAPGFSSGLKAHVFVSWLHPFKDQKLVVVGDQKMAVFDDTLPWETNSLSIRILLSGSTISPCRQKERRSALPFLTPSP
jgi:UDP-2-acetamido-3-amino-2,3-dideoxy-glucuronate N-acetyltransferase